MKSAEQLGYQSEDERTRYVSGGLEYLETFCQKKLSSKEEIQMWLRRMGQYHKSVLSKLTGYTGRFTNDVFVFLDEEQRLQRVSSAENRILLPAPNTSKRYKQMARVTLRYIYAIMSDKYNHEHCLKLERKFIAKNRKRWPHVNWEYGFSENKEREKRRRERGTT
jgi:hypothetical protein